MINRKPPAHLGPVVWLLVFVCVGCSGTPFGEQLTERLSEPDDPVEETTAVNPAAVNIPTGEPLTEQPSESGDSESGDSVEEVSPSSPTTTTTATADLPTPESAPPPPANGPGANELQGASPPDPPPTTQAPHPLNPTPYRLLLRLPAADPAAPAEAVTQALRAAGILFEVETIERLPNGPPSPPLAPSP